MEMTPIPFEVGVVLVFGFRHQETCRRAEDVMGRPGSTDAAGEPQAVAELVGPEPVLEEELPPPFLDNGVANLVGIGAAEVGQPVDVPKGVDPVDCRLPTLDLSQNELCFGPP